MLQIAYIRENREEVVLKLAKKNMDAKEAIDQVIALDEKRRATQAELDTIKSESNKLSKDIGDLMKAGEKAKAEILKEKSVQLREKDKELTEVLNAFANQLQDELYKLPNLPADIVPVGKTPEENLNVFEEGEIPKLHEGALPHWELAKKYDLIDFYNQNRSKYTTLIYCTDGEASLDFKVLKKMVWLISSKGSKGDYPGFTIYMPKRK